MSPLVRSGRNAAREAKRIKEIRKVKFAIRWHEQQRKKRQELSQERWASKQNALNWIKWNKENVKDVRKRALENAREDWKLGPLRPNRAAVGDPEKYGAMTPGQATKPGIRLKTHEQENKQREKRGLQLRYPLVVDDKAYFPIVKGDRVLITKGQDKGKIGEVREVSARDQEFFIKGINEQYYDSKIFEQTGRQLGPKEKQEVPLPFTALRLVVPYETLQHGVPVYKDAVVENIFMERHTTGIDPFTLKDYGDAAFPKEHQYDPQTGLPIFHRYVAGTYQRIAWPWELEEPELENTVPEKSTPEKSRLARVFGTLRHPIKSLKDLRSSKSSPEVSSTDGSSTSIDGKVQKKDDTIERLRQREEEKSRTMKPRSHDPQLSGAYDGDVTRNIVEGAESVAYTLLAPPYPETLRMELRGHKISDKASDGSQWIKQSRTRNSPVLDAVASQKMLAIESMKTPMQLRWELEQAKKLQRQKKEPLVKEKALLMALGQHMAKNMIKPKQQRQSLESSI